MLVGTSECGHWFEFSEIKYRVVGRGGGGDIRVKNELHSALINEWYVSRAPLPPNSKPLQALNVVYTWCVLGEWMRFELENHEKGD